MLRVLCKYRDKRFGIGILGALPHERNALPLGHRGDLRKVYLLGCTIKHNEIMNISQNTSGAKTFYESLVMVILNVIHFQVQESGFRKRQTRGIVKIMMNTNQRNMNWYCVSVKPPRRHWAMLQS